MEERRFHPLDYLSVAAAPQVVVHRPAGAVRSLVGAALAMFLPREYKSQAEIGIADPTLSPELLRGVQSFDAEERQRAVSQQLLSRTVLERVVREEHLRPAGRSRRPRPRCGRVSRDNIVVPQPIGRMGQGREEGIESFRLGYVDAAPERAQRIANRLATVFVEENSKTKTQQAREHLGSARAAAARRARSGWRGCRSSCA